MKTFPDRLGHFGSFGGQFVPETLMAVLEDLTKAYRKIRKDKVFQNELQYYLTQYVGRPTPLTFAQEMTRKLGGAKIYLKREDLCHTGAHKINNSLGQVLLAKKMGKKRIIAETGAGQHGVATATACALMGLDCVVYMGAEDVKRQSLNVYRMKLLGTQVIPVESGSKTLKDAINEAMRDWVSNVENTHYVLGSVAGSHPFPMIVRDFQSVIGNEARKQILKFEGKLPDLLIACVGGGSNSIGLFYPFLKDQVPMIGVEAGGYGIETTEHAARFFGGKIGVFQGARTYVLQNDDGQINQTHSISAGLDYAGVGPEHSYLYQSGRIQYTYAKDDEALQAFHELSKTEGIIPALESSHAIAELIKRAPEMRSDQVIIVNLSGRGDKDINIVFEKEIKNESH